MASPITIDIPEALLERARSEAILTNRSVDAVLIDWLQRGAPPPDPTYMIYTPLGLEAAVQPLMDALAADKLRNPDSKT